MLKYLFYLCVILLSFGQLGILSRSSGFSIYVFDLAVLSFAGIGIWYFLITKKLHFPKNLFFYLLFAVFAGISLLTNAANLTSSQVLIAFFYLVRFIAYICAGIIIYNMLRANLISLKQVVGTLLLSGVFLCLAGFVQLVLLPDFTTLDPTLGWDPHKNRLASTFFDPNFVGSYLFLLIILLFGLFKQKSMLLSHKHLVLLLTLFTCALFLTFSRSSWLALAIGILVYGVLKYRKLLMVAALVAFLAYFAVPRVQTRLAGITDPADSARFRFISWQNSLQIAQDNLAFGVGFNAYRYAQSEYGFIEAGTLGGNSAAGADSSFLFVFATTGVLGIISFLWAYFYPLIRKIDLSADSWVFTLALLAGLFIQTQFINAFFYPQILFLLACLIVCNRKLFG